MSEEGPGPGPGPSGAVSVREAARILGINPRSIRKRISRGILAATMIDGAYHVYLGAQSGQSDPPAPQEGQGQGRRAATPRPRARAETRADPSPTGAITRQDEQRVIIQEIIAPYVERLEVLALDLGRERLLREQAEAERDELRRRLAEVEGLDEEVARDIERRRSDIAAVARRRPGWWARLFMKD